MCILISQYFFFEQGQILCLSQIEEAVRDAEFILEAVVDDLEVKQELFESRLLTIKRLIKAYGHFRASCVTFKQKNSNATL